MLHAWQGILVAALMVGIVMAMFHHHVVRGEKARAWVGRGALLVDVDTRGEFAQHHPRVAISVPLEELGQRAHELGSPETPIVVFAQSWWRGAQAVYALRGMGYWTLYNAAGLGDAELT